MMKDCQYLRKWKEKRVQEEREAKRRKTGALREEEELRKKEEQEKRARREAAKQREDPFREMKRDREDRQRILLKGLHGTPEDLLKVVNEKTLKESLHGAIWKYGACLPPTNLILLVDQAVACGRRSGCYLLMGRPEFTEEMLRHYYPLLVKACTKGHAYHGVRGLIDNPNAPADLFFEAYEEPRLAEFRFEYFRRNYGQRRMSVEDVLMLECELVPFEKMALDNWPQKKLLPVIVKDERDLEKLDAVLKKYLPAQCPWDWDRKMSIPEFDYFANGE